MQNELNGFQFTHQQSEWAPDNKLKNKFFKIFVQSHSCVCLTNARLFSAHEVQQMSLDNKVLKRARFSPNEIKSTQYAESRHSSFLIPSSQLIMQIYLKKTFGNNFGWHQGCKHKVVNNCQNCC
ncbi:Hypothetical_protein [Hexamita inflata]|uniref:Hypothetical_protein n=1 Tax=Hexamita inflata TaxID=28002 RepID=A0ABP1J5Z7_9EUKA